MARTLRTTRTSRARDERGSMLVEALVAAAIVVAGGLATLVAFDSITRSSHTAERQAEAVALAEKEIERIVGKPYAQINDCTMPGPGTGKADDPKSFVGADGKLHVPKSWRPAGFATPPAVDLADGSRYSYVESFALNAGAGCLQPQEDASTAGVQGASRIAHTKIHRFITYQGAQCAPSLAATVTGALSGSLLSATFSATLTAVATADVSALCGATLAQEAKRVTVAVTLNRVDNQAGLRYPVYVSTLVPNPDAGLHAATGTVLD
jgi:hypothetical protein